MILKFSFVITDSQMMNLSSAASGKKQYETLLVTETKPFVFNVQLNRPKNLNALNNKMWMYVKNFKNQHFSKKKKIK